MKPHKDPKSGTHSVPAAPAAPVEASEDSVRVYNRSTRQTFMHDVGTGEAKKKYSVAPSSFATVPADVADRWMRLFPEVVIEAGVAQRELGGAAAELALVRGELATTKAANEKLVAANEQLVKENAELKAAANV